LGISSLTFENFHLKIVKEDVEDVALSIEKAHNVSFKP
jgi:hypothetical protein